MKKNGHRNSIVALGLGLLLGSLAQAQTVLASDTDPSLILLIWDPVAKVSYSHDTGLLGKSLYSGLSNDGSQQFWTLDPATDANFAKYLAASGDLANDVWMVIGGGKAASGTGPGTNVIYSTMVNTTANGVLNPQWDGLVGQPNSNLRSVTSSFPTSVYNPLMGGATNNNYATAAPGTASSFDTAGSDAYVGNMAPVLAGLESGGLDPGEAMFAKSNGFDTGNALGASGSSSWFYYLTSSSIKAADKISVSAFANSAYDAYWGLARTTNSANQQELVLSFTMQAAVTPTQTAAGALRRNQTDYAAQYSFAQQLGTPAGEFAGWTPSSALLGNTVTAVPEPASALLAVLGLTTLLAVRRKRKAD
ncbi:hypothetical protein [Pelomonas sp. KK5]|uniref:hypothetical protein n=1 Tax=Pelomonas sp. KK5 TaxID=1855730 RepID=UPI00097C23F2|nr:hypothetical protein [Pelomonas sp. KK5]